MPSKFKALANNQGFMKYFKNTSWLFMEKVLRMFVGLFVGVWIARYLGPEQFGLLSYAASFAWLFTAFATLGLDGIIVRELVKDESNRDVLLGTAFRLKFIGAFGVLLFLAIAINFTSNNHYTNVIIFIIASAVIFQSFNVIDYYFQSKVLSKYIVYANIISLLISSVFKIALILYNAPLVAFAWVVLFDSAILALGFLYFYLHNQLSFKSWQFNKGVAILLLKDSWPLMLSGVVVSIYMRIDQIMIKEILDNAAVGQYAAAVKLSEAWYFIPVAITSSIFPAIISAKKRNEELYINRIQKLYDMMVYIGLFVALPTMLLGNWVIDTLFGVKYNQAGDVLIIHIWSGVFVGLLVASGKWIINENLNKQALYRNIAGVVVNIVLNYFFIGSYGIVGAAYATLISYIVASFLYDYLNNRLRMNFYIKVNSLTFKTIRNHMKG